VIQGVLVLLQQLDPEQQGFIFSRQQNGRTGLWWLFYYKNICLDPSKNTPIWLNNYETILSLLKNISKKELKIIFQNNDLLLSMNPVLLLYFYVNSNNALVPIDTALCLPEEAVVYVNNAILLKKTLWTSFVEEFFVFFNTTFLFEEQNVIAQLCWPTLFLTSATSAHLQAQASAHYQGKNILIWLCDVRFDALINRYIQNVLPLSQTFFTVLFSPIRSSDFMRILNATYSDSSSGTKTTNTPYSRAKISFQKSMTAPLAHSLFLQQSTLDALNPAVRSSLFSWTWQQWLFFFGIFISLGLFYYIFTLIFTIIHGANMDAYTLNEYINTVQAQVSVTQDQITKILAFLRKKS
jgi:hypothetical protein